jgi:hypothetical protein
MIVKNLLSMVVPKRKMSTIKVALIVPLLPFVQILLALLLPYNISILSACQSLPQSILLLTIIGHYRYTSQTFGNLPNAADIYFKQAFLSKRL